MTPFGFRLDVGFAALLLAATGLARACPSESPSGLSLLVLPGEIRGLEHVLQVDVQDDGCVRVRRPAHWWDSGRFAGALAAPALRSAQTAALLERLDGFDGERVAAELARNEASRGEAFSVAGADRYVLRWTDATGRRREATFDGIFQYAERHPMRQDLAAFAALVSLLQDEAVRTDLPEAGGTP